MNGPWEVEQKYHVRDVPALLLNLQSLNFHEEYSQRHSDTYFRHPCRNFRETDEAFRLRRFNDELCVTYKGPRLPNLEGSEVKTRPEIELALNVAEQLSWMSMLEHLGFVALPSVRKWRRVHHCRDAQPAPVTSSAAAPPTAHRLVVAVDEVEQLGSFAEVEIVVQQQCELESAQAAIRQLAERLGLKELQPRSYLSQLLSKLGVE